MIPQEIFIRPIQESDNEALAKIIRDTLTEYKANKPGTVYYDPTTDHLSEVFKTEGSFYFVAEDEGKILGGAGIFPTNELPAGTCELVKMYLLPGTRGKGLGRKLMENCIEKAKSLGYQSIYLETMPELEDAIKLYKKSGFIFIDFPLGDSGHTGCDLFMLKYIGPKFISLTENPTWSGWI